MAVMSEGASEELLNEFISKENLLPEAIRILKACDPKIQARVVTRGSCAGVRDQIAVIKKRIQEASTAYNLTKDSLIHQEVEDFIMLHNFDEKACHVLRTVAQEVQKSVLDRGLCTEAKNPSAIILSRIRSAQKGDKGDGKGKGKGDKDGGKGKGDKGSKSAYWPELDSSSASLADSTVAMGEMHAMAEQQLLGVGFSDPFAGKGGDPFASQAGDPFGGKGADPLPPPPPQGGFGGGFSGGDAPLPPPPMFSPPPALPPPPMDRGGGGGRDEGRRKMECYNCGGPHMGRECPQSGGKGGGSGGRSEGRDEGRRKLECYNCGGPHMGRECPQTMPSPDGGGGGSRSGGSGRRKMECYNCGGPHMGRECPTGEASGKGGGSEGGGGKGGGKPAMECYNCGGPHMGRECTLPDTTGGRRPMACFNCNGPHIARECPMNDGSKAGEMCGDFKRGKCDRGDRCKYSHGEASAGSLLPPMLNPSAMMPMMPPPQQPNFMEVWSKHNDPTIPKVYWMTLSDDNPLAQAGFRPEGVCIHYEKAQVIFQETAPMLSEVMTNVTADFKLEHDEDWKKFPGLGPAFKALTGEENWYSVATSAEHGKWAAGFHASRKGREAAAKLALAVSIVAGTDLVAHLGAKYPEFGRLFSMGPSMEAMAMAMPLGAPPGAGLAFMTEESARKKRRHGWGDAPAGGEPPPPQELLNWLNNEGGSDTHISTAFAGTGTPPVIAVEIPQTSPIVQHGYLAEAPALVFDKDYQHIYTDGGRILKCVLGDIHAEIVHDADWKQYPEVAQSLPIAGIKSDCFAVAICPDLCKWGIGVAASWKNRESAARLALAVAVALEAPHFEYAVSQFPAFQEVCANAGIMEAVALYRAPVSGNLGP